MRTRYRQVKRNGKWILVEIPTRNGKPLAPEIMPDIQPYTSMIDGTTISSRSQHRAHLRAHDCREIGNETEALMTAYDRIPDTLSESRHEAIVSQFRDMSHKEFKSMMRRSVQQARGY